MPELDEKWEFGEEVTDVFDDMLERSIPEYEEMRAACLALAFKYAQRKTAIVDLGCSRGEAIAPLIDKFGVNNQFVGVEVSAPMLAAARQRFSGMIDAGVVTIRDMDLRTDFPQVSASVILSVLTIQFTPIEYRLRILQDVYNHLIPGGAFILVEKVIGASAELDATFVEEYYTMKRANGYTQEQIDRKRLSLEGALVPMTANWNEQSMRVAGFTQVDCFWRWMNFAGWIAIK